MSYAKKVRSKRAKYYWKNEIMEEAFLFRQPSTQDGVLGLFTAPEFSCYTLEPPDRNNEKNYSCIPIGNYPVRPHISPKFKQCFLLQDVPNRSFILIHGGNLAGDYKLGLIRHSHGCILTGSSTGILSGQRAVLASKTMLRKMLIRFTEPFLLKIREV